MTSAIHKVACVKCGTVTDHVDITRISSTHSERGNGRKSDLEVEPLMMCLVCRHKRPNHDH
jgi:hypothetical protein